MGSFPKFSNAMGLFTRRTSFQPGAMANEINSDAPPNVFQLFNENRTFYFESDISALPNPPCTLPSSTTPPTVTVSKSWKSLSHPNLSGPSSVSVSTTSASKPGPKLTPANIHLPAAIMAPTTAHTHLHHHHPHHHHPRQRHDSTSDSDSEDARYHSDSSCSKSGILKSFKHELNIFSHIAPQKSVSNPSTPRRGSSPDLNVALDSDEYRPRANSDPRKLSLVPEETAEERARKDSIVSSQAQSVAVQVSESGSGRPRSTSSEPRDGAFATNLPLTQKVIDWFNTPQPKVEVNKPELNAISPSSF